MKSMQDALSLEELLASAKPFIGQWNRLLSTTNWEKGKIIHLWRQSLIQTGSPITEYSDEAWSNMVGRISGQHVGRLRRVYARFGETYGQYPGIFWSHFQAALDWDDAEMWLEGAVQNGWSVAKMRTQRAEALGLTDEPVADEENDLPPTDEETISDDAEPLRTAGDFAEAYDPSGPVPEGPDFGDADDPSDISSISSTDPAAALGDVPAHRPFESLPALPADVTEAFESMKIVVLRHRMDQWREISRDDMLACLDALRELALAPVPGTNEAPF